MTLFMTLFVSWLRTNFW